VNVRRYHQGTPKSLLSTLSLRFVEYPRSGYLSPAINPPITVDRAGTVSQPVSR